MFRPNQEIVGQGLSNLVGGFFQSYAGSGPFTRSGVNAVAGAKTPLSAVAASLFLGAIFHVIFYLKGVGKVDLAGADFLLQVIREVRAAGGSFRIVALFPPLLACLRRFHVIEEMGEHRLYIFKDDALTAVMAELNRDICANCTKRIYLECVDMPGSKVISFMK